MTFGGAASAALVIKIVTDAAAARRDLDKTAGSVGKVEQGLAGAAVPAAAALAAVGLFATGASKAASDVEQSFGALESVFGDQADAAKRMSESAATSVGLASADYAQMAATLASQLRNMGVAEEDLLPMTERLIAQGSDMAATFGGPTSDAVAAISSLLRGERDPIERYGVSIKDATIQAELAAAGLDNLTGEAKTAASTQATLALLTDQTANAQGAFAREADTAAGASARANAQWTNAQAAIGEVLLPLLVAASTILGDVAGWMTENAEVAQILLGVIAGVAAAVLLANIALKAYRAAQVAVQVATKIWTGLQWLLNTALAANPIGLVVLAIAALVAIFVIAYNKSETFRRIVDGVFRAVQKIVGTVVDFIVNLFGELGDALAGPFEALVGIVRDVFRTIKGIVSGAVEFIEGLIEGITGAFEGVADFVDTINPFAAAAPPAAGGAAVGARGVAAPVPGLRGGRTRLSATVTHRIDDPGGALARVPGGAAGVASILNRGTDASGLYVNLQHAAGIR